MGDSGDDYLLVYKRFFDNFALSVDLTDQLPVKVAGYNLTKFEIPGAVTDWCLQYLNLRHCPENLIVPLILLVLDEINQMIQKQPESCGYRPSDDDFHSLRLMQVTMRKLVEICSQYRDNAQLSTLPSPNVGVFTPLISTCAVKNSRRSMEDRHVTIQDFHLLNNIQDYGSASYYGVFDGHNGLDAAVYSVAHLHQYLAASSYYPTDPVNALKDAFRQTDKQFICKSVKENLQSGTTAVCALLRPKEKMLYVAWLGDSQAVLVRQGRPLQLVKPHKPERVDEKLRIEEMGGTVLFWGIWRVNGQLAVSRAIGDVKYKPYVSADPDVESIQLDGTEDFLILACDGLWDYVSEQLATNAVYHHLSECPGDVEGVSQRLVALSKEQGSTDNISVVVVFLVEPSEVTQRRHMETASPNPFLKQNGADLYLGVPTNGKIRSCSNAVCDDEDDFGPETDVDMVDDVLLSPAISAAKALVTGKKDYDDDLERQRQQLSDFDDPADIDRSRDTPTPPAHEVAGNADADNLIESGDGEDSEDDEWNFVPGTEEVEKEQKTDQEEEDDDMSSQLNPNAAEFVPISPKRSFLGDVDPEISSSSLCFKPSFDNVAMPTQLEFSSYLSKCPGDLDLINGQNESQPIESEINHSSAVTVHQTLESTNDLPTKAEFGDAPVNASNPFSTEESLHDNQENVNPFSSAGDCNSFNVQNLISSTSSELKDAFDAASNFEPVRSIKEFKTFAECLAEPKPSVTTPELDDNVIPETPKSTVVEAPISPSSDVSPIPHHEDIDSSDDYLASVPKSPELISPSEEPLDMYTGQEPTSSSGFESESGAEETECNILAESNLADKDGFILETKRLSPPIQTLSFKPIETFGDKNPFGLLENPSPIYKPLVFDELENIQSFDSSKEVGSNSNEVPPLPQDLIVSTSLHSSPIVEDSQENEVKDYSTFGTTVDIHLENVPAVLEEPSGQVSQDLGLKQDEFAFGGLESEIKANEFIFGAGTSELETQEKLEIAPILNENEESKIRQDEQESEQEVKTKDAAFGVDSKQETIDKITSAIDEAFVSKVSGQEFNNDQPLFNQFEEKDSQAVEYEAKESDFQFDPTDSNVNFVPNSFNTGLNDFEVCDKKVKLELDTSKDQLFDTSKEISNLHENEKESDTAIENIPSEDVILKESASLVEGPISFLKGLVKSPKDELKLDLSDNSPAGHSPKKDSSPLSPIAKPFVPTQVPVVEPLFKQVILEKKFSELNSEEDAVLCDFGESVQSESNALSSQEQLSTQIPKLDLDTYISLSEPEIHDVREGIDEIIKEAELISSRSASEHLTNIASEVKKVSETLILEPVSAVLENELIIQSSEPTSDSSHPLLSEEKPLSPDHMEIVQEKDTPTNIEQNSATEVKSEGTEHATEVLEDGKQTASTTETPPPTPAPGLVEEQDKAKEGLLAVAAAVAAAGAVTSAAVVATNKIDAKKSTSQVKKGTQVSTKKPGDTTTKLTSKNLAATTKPATATTKSAAGSKPPVKAPSEAKKIPSTTTKVLTKTTVSAKPTNTSAKPAPKSLTVPKTNGPAPKPSSGITKTTSLSDKAVPAVGSKPTTPSSKPSTPVSKPSTPTVGLRPSSAPKPPSPTKSVASPRTSTSKPIAKNTTKIAEKKPLTNGEPTKPAPIKKPDVTKKSATSTTSTSTTSTSTTTKQPPITRPSSATAKVASKTQTTTTAKQISAMPKSASSSAATKTKPALKTVTSTTTLPKTRPLSGISTTKSIDKTGKDNANKQISSEKTGSKTLGSKTTTKKTETKSAGSGKPKPVTKPGSDIKKAESKEKIGPTQEESITTSNGYGDILENGIKKDDSPLDNLHQDIIEAIN